jgi:hypothetical protein
MGEIKELTIAQALRRIKDIKGKIAKHTQNAQSSVTHKTRNVPAYVFQAEWEASQQLISDTKAIVDFEGKSRPLTWCTKRLAELKGAIAWHEALPVRAQDKTIEEEHTWNSKLADNVSMEVEYTCHLPEAKRAERVVALELRGFKGEA